MTIEPHRPTPAGPDPDWRRRLAGRRIVITGGHGAIGSHLLRHLAAAGAHVLCLDLTPAPTHPIRPARGGSVRSIACDIRSPDLATAVAAHRPDTVIHLAAQVGVPASTTHPGFDADVNIRGTIAVAEAATAARARLIFAATCAIYGHPHRLPVAEDSPLAPLSPYGLSKAAAVQYLDWFTSHCGLPVTSLVLGNVYGAGAPGAVIDRFVAATAAGAPTVLHGDGTATRDFVHIDDVAEAFLRACTAPPAGRVNIGSGTETSIRDIHALVTGLTGHTIPAQRQHVREGDIPRMRLNVTRAATVLAWRARTDLAAGVTALFQAAFRSATAARRPDLLDAG